MIGIILAAGVGSRLRPMTNNKPKCLVKTANKPILQYQLDSYLKAGIRDLVVVVGYESEVIRNYCKHISDFNITIIENPIYEDSNNMYSLYLVSQLARGKPFILNNADLSISDEIISLMVNCEDKDCVAMDAGRYNEESMKVSVNDEGYISNISKLIPEQDSEGCSIDFYKFSGRSSETLFEEIERIIETEKNLKDWTEVAMQHLFNSQDLKFRALDIAGLPWVEIDDYDDLALSDKIFCQIDRNITDYSHYCFDLDGTLFVGGQAIPGASEKVGKLKKQGKTVSFLSNNSSNSKAGYVNKLSAFGFDCKEADIVLSSDASINFLKDIKCEKVYVLGTTSLQESVIDAGIAICPDNPDFVLVGYDTELTYSKLVTASKLINRGVDYIATHCDVVCPSEFGPIPDIGLLTMMLEKTTGKKPYKIFGKPGTEMLDGIAETHGVGKHDMLIIGDRLYTDIKMAVNANVDSLLVLTGDTSREVLEFSQIVPNYVLNAVSDMQFEQNPPGN